MLRATRSATAATSPAVRASVPASAVQRTDGPPGVVVVQPAGVIVVEAVAGAVDGIGGDGSGVEATAFATAW